MSYARLPDELLESMEAMRLSRSARLLYLEGLSFCSRQLTDGVIDVRLARISDDDDVDARALELVLAGLWEPLPNGFRVVDYLTHQDSRDRVEYERARLRRNKERNRRHKAGDHSQCTRGRYCPAGAVDPDVNPVVSSETASVTTSETGPGVSPRPHHTSPHRGEGEGEGEADGDPDAPDGGACDAFEDDGSALNARLRICRTCGHFESRHQAVTR